MERNLEQEPSQVVPQALRDLWRNRAQRLATNVATRGREHREIAHAAALIGEDYHDRFLIELIQNANDQAVLGDALGSTVVVVRAKDYLAVSNAGEVVTQRNLERISSIADSDKTGVLVGNKGVGFKAVSSARQGIIPESEESQNLILRSIDRYALRWYHPLR